MKPFTRIAIRVGLTAMLVGGVIGAAGYFAGAHPNIGYQDGRLRIIENKEVEQHDTDMELPALRQVRISTRYADVEVKRGSSYGVELICRGNTESIPRLSYEVDGDVLLIQNLPEEQSGGHVDFYLMHLRSNSYYECKAIVYLPLGAELDSLGIQSQHGYVEVADINTRDLLLELEYGDGVLSGKATNETQISLYHSETNLKNLDTGRLRADGSYSDIRIENTKRQPYTELTFSGEQTGLSLSGFQADQLQLSTSYRDIILRDGKADSMRLDTYHGDVEANDVASGQCQLEQQYGSILATRWESGQLTANQYQGSVSLSGILTGETRISSQYGNVELDIARPEEDYWFDLSAEYGGINLNDSYNESAVKSGRENAENLIYVDGEHSDIAILTQ